jgi:microcystin-dependent protein
MCEPFLGQIVMFAGNFAPRGWALCDGQLLPIHQHDALFSILGTSYVGDGRTTFAVPDLRGRVPVHPGSVPGLTPRTLGRKGGHEKVHLNRSDLSNAAHVDVAAAGKGDTSIQLDMSHDNMQPYQCINFIIALEGIYPSRP